MNEKTGKNRKYKLKKNQIYIIKKQDQQYESCSQISKQQHMLSKQKFGKHVY